QPARYARRTGRRPGAAWGSGGFDRGHDPRQDRDDGPDLDDDTLHGGRSAARRGDQSRQHADRDGDDNGADDHADQSRDDREGLPAGAAMLRRHDRQLSLGRPLGRRAPPGADGGRNRKPQADQPGHDAGDGQRQGEDTGDDADGYQEHHEREQKREGTAPDVPHAV